jgi:hypothetical protein
MPILGWLDSRAAKAPRWILRGATGDLLRAVAVTLDAVTETARQAVRLRMPTKTSPDGQAAIAEERLEARATAFVYEDDTVFGERLRTAWSRRRLSGTKAGLVAVFQAFGFPSFVVYDKGEWFASKKWHAWVHLQAPQPWGPGPVLGDGWVLGDGSTLGSSATVSEVRNVREVIASWVPPHTRTYVVFATSDGPILGDGWELGDGTVLGDPGLCRWRLGKESLS